MMIGKTRRARLRGSLVALAMTALLALACHAGMSTQAQAAGTIGMQIVANATMLRRGDVVSGALPGTQPMHIVVALRLRNPDQLDRFLAMAVKKDATRRTMSREEFNAQHAPSPTQALTVRNYLSLMGFRNIAISPSRMLVSADGSAETARAAFLTSFVRVRTRDGRIAYANNSDARIPLALKDSVLSVIGLQNVYQAHTFARLAQPKRAGTQAITGHNPLEFPAIYGGTGLPTAAGETVGILSEGKLTQTITDLNTFTTNNSLAAVTTQIVNTNGTSNDTSGVLEWDLDSQTIVGMGGGQVGKIIFYDVPSLLTSDLTANIDTAVTANVATVINVSLGVCETAAQGDGSAAAQDQLFKTALAQGQTFSVASGDNGADECKNGTTTPSYPASSPYVIAVGGTTLNASSTTYSSETVWIDAGGSPSKFEPKPSWQSAVVSGTTRGVPDLAFDADPNSGAQIIFNGSLSQAGGTSLAAPLFAASWARLLSAHPTLGFAAPHLYQDLTSVDYHDITSGNNGGETAAVGWDFASGFGSLILGNANNDLGPPSLSIADVSVTQSNTSTTQATFTVTLSRPTTTAVSYNIATADGTATAGVDYVASSLVGVTIPAGQTSKTFVVTILSDPAIEASETFFVNLSAAVGATIARSQATGTILNNNKPVLTIADLTVGEGTSGTSVATFTISLSSPTFTSVTYNIATANGTAIAGTDYVASSLVGQTIPAGQTSKTFAVTIIGNTNTGPNKTFNVNITNVVGATSGKTTAVCTILNVNSPLAPSLSIADVSVVEGNSGTSTATFTVKLSKPYVIPVTYNIATADSTAKAGSDYVARSLVGGTIAVGQISKTFTVTINGDTTVEPNETFFVNLSSAVGATIARSRATGTIINDDGPTLSIADVSITEGNSGTKAMTFTVKMSQASASAVTYNIATADGTAAAGSDYVASSLTGQSIPAGQTSKTFTVTISGDTTVEPNETFSVNLSAATGATIARSQAIGTILNDDGPTLSIADASATKGTSGTTPMTFTITLSQPSASAVTYSIATADGTAIAGTDYVASYSVKPVSIPAGQTTSTFTVPIAGNTTVSANKTFFVNLIGATGASILRAQAIGTIIE